MLVSSFFMYLVERYFQKVSFYFVFSMSIAISYNLLANILKRLNVWTLWNLPWLSCLIHKAGVPQSK